MTIFNKVAEKYLPDGIASGELDGPAWHGKPLPEEDLSLVPGKQRMAYRILKPSGFILSEIETINRLICLFCDPKIIAMNVK